MPKKITAWHCEFCSRYLLSKARIIRHEEICFSNPNRKILEGQMAIWATIPKELTMQNSYGVSDSEWTELHDNPSEEIFVKYRWWPMEDDGSIGLGYVYRSGKWVKIDGYVPPHFAPGFSWRNEYLPEDVS